MTRSFTIFTLCCAIVALSVVGLSCVAGAASIAILKSADLAPYNQAVAGFKASLPSTTRFVDYDLKGDAEAGRKYARKIHASAFDLVLAVGLKAAVVAKLELPDVPIIFCMVLDPDRYDLTADNMIGVSMHVPIPKQIDLLHTLLPGIRRIGVLYDPEINAHRIAQATQSARVTGHIVIAREIHDSNALPPTLRELLPTIDALWLIPDRTVVTEDSFPFILGAALDRNVPVIGFAPEFVRSGAVLSISVHYEGVGQHAAGIAQMVLDRTSDLPSMVESERVSIALNFQTTQFLGMTLSPDTFARVDERY